MSIAIRMGLWGMPASTRDWKDYLEKLIRKKKNFRLLTAVAKGWA